MAIRIALTLVVEMTDQQAGEYAWAAGIERGHSGRFADEDIVDDVRSYVLTGVQDLPAFTMGGADVSIKEG